MADGESALSGTERGERRGSIGRALERLRAAVRRRGSGGGTGGSAANMKRTPSSRENAHASRGGERSEAASTLDARGQNDNTTDSPTISNIAPKAQVALDDAVLDEGDEPLLPIPPTRNADSGERARSLFARYGLPYDPRRRSNEEPAAKLRRVEKPVRLRIHWCCHECQGHFSKDRTCLKCGHHRCADCTRQPGRRVRELLEDAKKARDSEERRAHASSTTSRVPECEAVAAVPEPAPSSPIAFDDFSGDDEMEVSETYKWVMQTRPRSGKELTLKSKTQVVRRACHKCDTVFSSSSKNECDKCQHSRCNLCPRWPPKSDKATNVPAAEAQAPVDPVPMVAVVQRVYRKPRQRVRYKCDQCQAFFIDGSTCQECGHDRCSGCSRDPYVAHVRPVMTMLTWQQTKEATITPRSGSAPSSSGQTGSAPDFPNTTSPDCRC
jgi:hypothetical protein